MKSDKKFKDDFFDDGRVVANMDIEGMPGSMFKRKPFIGLAAKKSKAEAETPSKDEHRAIIRGIATSYILFGVVFFGFLALFILFCKNVWFK